MNIKKQFREGLITNNPVLVQQIGMCATMAITTSLFNGVGMGLSVLIILTCCNVVVSAMRKIIPDEIRLAIFVVVIAGFVTIVDLLLQAFVPALSSALGVFIPLIVVNCIIIGRAEAFCQKQPVGASFLSSRASATRSCLSSCALCVSSSAPAVSAAVLSTSQTASASLSTAPAQASSSSQRISALPSLSCPSADSSPLVS